MCVCEREDVERERRRRRRINKVCERERVCVRQELQSNILGEGGQTIIRHSNLHPSFKN